MDPLLPTLRKRKRYIAIGILGTMNITKNTLNNSIYSMSNSLYGEIETSKFGVSVLKYDQNIGIIRCWHRYVFQVLAIISLINIIENKNINIRIFGYSGTIKSVQKKYILSNLENFNCIYNDLKNKKIMEN